MNATEFVALLVAVGLLGYLLVCALEAGVVLMTANAWIQFLIFLAVLLAAVKPWAGTWLGVVSGSSLWFGSGFRVA